MKRTRSPAPQRNLSLASVEPLDLDELASSLDLSAAARSSLISLIDNWEDSSLSRHNTPTILPKPTNPSRSNPSSAKSTHHSSTPSTSTTPTSPALISSRLPLPEVISPDHTTPSRSPFTTPLNSTCDGLPTALLPRNSVLEGLPAASLPRNSVLEGLSTTLPLRNTKLSTASSPSTPRQSRPQSIVSSPSTTSKSRFNVKLPMSSATSRTTTSPKRLSSPKSDAKLPMTLDRTGKPKIHIGKHSVSLTRSDRAPSTSKGASDSTDAAPMLWRNLCKLWEGLLNPNAGEQKKNPKKQLQHQQSDKVEKQKHMKIDQEKPKPDDKSDSMNVDQTMPKTKPEAPQEQQSVKVETPKNAVSIQDETKPAGTENAMELVPTSPKPRLNHQTNDDDTTVIVPVPSNAPSAISTTSPKMKDLPTLELPTDVVPYVANSLTDDTRASVDAPSTDDTPTSDNTESEEPIEEVNESDIPAPTMIITPLLAVEEARRDGTVSEEAGDFFDMDLDESDVQFATTDLPDVRGLMSPQARRESIGSVWSGSAFGGRRNSGGSARGVDDVVRGLDFSMVDEPTQRRCITRDLVADRKLAYRQAIRSRLRRMEGNRRGGGVAVGMKIGMDMRRTGSRSSYGDLSAWTWDSDQYSSPNDENFEEEGGQRDAPSYQPTLTDDKESGGSISSFVRVDSVEKMDVEELPEVPETTWDAKKKKMVEEQRRVSRSLRSAKLGNVPRNTKLKAPERRISGLRRAKRLIRGAGVNSPTDVRRWR